MISRAKRLQTQARKPLLSRFVELNIDASTASSSRTSDQTELPSDRLLRSLQSTFTLQEIPIKIVLESYAKSRRPPNSSDVPLLKAALALLWTSDTPTSQLILELGAVSKTAASALSILLFLEFLAAEAKGSITSFLCKTYDDGKFINSTLIGPLLVRVEALGDFCKRLSAYVYNCNKKSEPPRGQSKSTPASLVARKLNSSREPKVSSTPLATRRSSEAPKHAVSTTTEPKIPVKQRKAPTSKTEVLKTTVAENKNTEQNNSQTEILKKNSNNSTESVAAATSKRVSTASRMRKVETPRTTAATLLRDHALILRRDQEAQKELLEAMCSLVDSESISASVEKAKAEAEAEEQVAQARRRMKVMILREDALIARENAVIRKIDEARSVKEENEALAAEIQRRDALTEVANREVVASIQEGAARAQDAKTRVQEENLKTAREEAAKIASALQEAAARQREEVEARRELIRQIRALEQVGDEDSRGKFSSASDDTTVAGNGLLAEMSIAELRIRLECIKEQTEAQCEVRRAAIAAQKAQKTEDLLRCRRRVEESQKQPSARQPAAPKALKMDTPELQIMRDKLRQRKSELKKIVHGNVASPRRYKVKIKRVIKNPLANYKPPKSRSAGEIPDAASQVKCKIHATVSEPSSLELKSRVIQKTPLCDILGVDKTL